MPRTTDLLLLALACFCAYGAIDPDGAWTVLTGIGNTLVQTLRG